MAAYNMWFSLRAVLIATLLAPVAVVATPANRAAFERHYDRFLASSLRNCTTCHLPSSNKAPESLEEFPHNPFGHRLKVLGDQLEKSGKAHDITARLSLIAVEDTDGDGAANEVELLLGHFPGDVKDTPAREELGKATALKEAYETFLKSYRWQPFETVRRPVVPKTERQSWIRNPIDAFIAAEHDKRELKPQPEASREALLRRLYMDLIGLSPTPEEQVAFERDPSPDAYDRMVDRLLNDPRYGERWGRHWMDVWRYSDWAGWSGGNQIRDSKPHIWRWRDWIVESLNTDKGYDRMVAEMIAADELAPGDTNAVRATGYLVRNFKLLSREQWLEDTVKHTAQAFMGITMGCAKCHDHMYDPITQAEYYRMRAIFEPHNVRTDKLPGELNTEKDGLVWAFDKELSAPTYFFIRGDERQPDTNRVMKPGVPKVLSSADKGGELTIEPVKLPKETAFPDKREFVIRDMIAASEQELKSALTELEKARSNGAASEGGKKPAELKAEISQAKHNALLAVLKAEKLEDNGGKESDEWKLAARETVIAQRAVVLQEARFKLCQAELAEAKAAAKVAEIKPAEEASEKHLAKDSAAGSSREADKRKQSADKAADELKAAKTKTEEARKALAEVEKEQSAEPGITYKPRPAEQFPETSSGRRLAFARWLIDRENPLTARVAMNHIWLRHFGRGIVPTAADFGRNGGTPSHPQLLDWLAAEFMARNWSMKAMHRLIVTSSTYRMASTPDAACAKTDPDNIYLWRMPSRRLEAEIIRDNLLQVSHSLEPQMGGPEIDHNQGLVSKRRSIYLRIAAEKEVEFLKIFDGPSVTECYERRPSVVPQQALALANSEIALAQAKKLANALSAESGRDDTAFINQAFRQVLARSPQPKEVDLCREFLAGKTKWETGPEAGEKDGSRSDSALRRRENLVLVLFNHNDFVTLR